MKISVIESPGNFIVKDAGLPELQAGEVLVKLQGTGVCASNLPVWEGRDWFTYPFEPGAPGHEGYGTVEATGSEVKDFSRGDRVAMISYHAYAEYDKADASSLVKLPGALGDGPFPGEPAACAVNVFKRSAISRGDNVLVIGAGYLGCMLVQLLKHAGVYVTVISRRKTSLDFASLAGADRLIVFDDIYRTGVQLRELYPGGIPVIIEATGSQQALDLATQVISVRGRLVIAGYHQDGFRNIDMQQWNWKGIDVINAHERDMQAYTIGMKEAVDLAVEGVLNPGKFITHFVEQEDMNSAFRLLSGRHDKFLKAVITY